MKKGFSLLSIMLALAVGSILGGLLMQTLWQLGFSLKKVVNISSVDTRISVVQNLFEKELAGAFIPRLTLIDRKSEEETENKKSDEAKVANKPPAPSKKPKKVIPPKVFLSKNSGNDLEMLTFITCNPLEVYNNAKCRRVRVMYTIRPDNKLPGTFELYRQESSNIMNIKQFNTDGEGKQIKGFVVIDGIKSISTEFLALPVPEKEKQPVEKAKGSLPPKKTPEEPKKEKEDERKEFVKMVVWDVEEQRKKEKQQEPPQDQEVQKLPLVPQFIKMKITLFGHENKQEHTFSFIFAPNYGIKPVLLEGLKPLQRGTASDKKPQDDKLTNIMDKNPLSGNLQSKFNKWKPGAKGGPPPPPTARGAISRGMSG